METADPGVVVLSKLATKILGLPNRPIIVGIVVVLLTTVFWGNLFRFYPSLIDRTYDDTSEGLVIGRLARSAAQGLTSANADLGLNVDPKRPGLSVPELYADQKRYFANPPLVNSLDLGWGPYPNQVGLQGILFSVIDLINPLPREWRIGFYHLLASLMSAGALVWIAEILRRRFGWAAFCGFLIPLAIEPMLTALAPNLYWLVGIWFVPMAIAMLLADEDNPRRRFYLVATAFVFFLAKALCGYEFVSTVILAAAVGCLLGTKEGPEKFRQIVRNVAWIVSAGIAGFGVAVLAHAAKLGGFAVIADRAGARIAGDSSSLQEQLVLGKFVSFQAVIFRYLEGNYITLIKNFGIPLGLFVLVAVLSLMDKKIIWYLGPDRRKLQICALAFLASLTAPLSWFVLAKAHSFVHPPINFILWYVPTIPLGGVLLALSLKQAIENRSAWGVDIARSAITLAIPAAIVLTVAAIYVSDRLLQTEKTWVVAAHAKGIPLFESQDLGVEVRMADQWFTLQYDCGVAASVDGFFVRAYEGDTRTDYIFKLSDRQVYAKNHKCFYAQAKADRPYSRVSFGATSAHNLIWERDALIPIPDALTLEPLTDANWEHGVNRSSGTEFLLRTDFFGRLFLKKGDHLQISSSDQRAVTAILSLGPYTTVSVDGAPVKSADAGIAPIRIIRQ
jgi:hypothetical protein